MQHAVYTTCLPNRVLQVIASADDLPTIHPAHGKTQIGGAVTAYVCEGTTCSLPVQTAADLAAALPKVPTSAR
jgi:uncharacterized protein YyaL (SSP411 family)